MDTTGIALRAMAFVTCVLAAGAAGAQIAYPPANIEVTVAVGQKAMIWEQRNHTVRCRVLRPPTFELDSKPSLGTVDAQWVDYTVPEGFPCEEMRFSGMIVWYQAGDVPGTDVVVWTIGFPSEFSSNMPSTGDHRVTTTIIVK